MILVLLCNYIINKGSITDNKYMWESNMLRIKVSSSVIIKDSVGVEYFVVGEIKRLATHVHDNAWMRLDLTDELMKPNYFTLRPCSLWRTEAINDDINWETVKKH